MAVVRLLLLTLSLLVLCSGCAAIKSQSGLLTQRLRDLRPKPPPPPERNEWHADEVLGPPSIVVNLSEQEAYFYKGKQLAGRSQISTGKGGFETPPGHYRIIQKDLHHVSTLYGDYVDTSGDVVKRNVDVTKNRPPPGARFRGAKMPYFMRIKAGYGLHAGYLPGYPASHGCIRMPRQMAAHFYHAVSTGTPVRVEE